MIKRWINSSLTMLLIELSISVEDDGVAPLTVDLSALNNAGTDDQNLTSATIDAANVLTIAIEDGNLCDSRSFGLP